MQYLIKEKAELDNIADILNNAQLLAVDTEFLREKTYNAKLCLIQLGIGNDQYCVDVLAIDDLSVIKQVFQNTNIVKIFHAARQDMEVLYQTFGILPKPIFDTQLAAAFCGADMQIGYASMVESNLNIEMPKSQARTDWTRRPLSDKQLDYAAKDVEYLEELYHIFKQKLEDSDKLGWFMQDIESYYQTTKYHVEPTQAYKRLSGGSLKLPQQSALKELATWRETVAQQKNIPRTWVVRDDSLYQIAITMPKKVEHLQKIQALSPRMSKQYAAPIIDVVEKAEPISQPLWRHIMPLDKQQKSICSSMMQMVRQQAETIQTAQGLLATRKDIESLFRTQGSKKLLVGWRKETIGDKLLDFLQT